MPTRCILQHRLCAPHPVLRWHGCSFVGEQRVLHLSWWLVSECDGPNRLPRMHERELLQARRWTLGAAEVFHYFMIKTPMMPVMTALSWGVSFLFYYGILLCCSHLYGLTLGLSSAFILAKDTKIFGTSFPMFYLTVHISLVVLFLNSLSMFILDRMSQRLLIPRPEEKISLVRYS